MTPDRGEEVKRKALFNLDRIAAVGTAYAEAATGLTPWERVAALHTLLVDLAETSEGAERSVYRRALEAADAEGWPEYSPAEGAT